MSYSLSQIKDIFSSGSHDFRNEMEVINEIHFLIEHGYLQISRIHIDNKDKYLSLFDGVEIKNNYNASGGGSSHVALKILASKFLLEKRGIQPVFEHPFCGYFPDVITTDKTIVIECGHTQNPEKIFEYFIQGDISEFIQIPYPYDEDKYIYGYSFKGNSNLKEFLVFLANEKRLKIKKIIQNRN